MTSLLYELRTYRVRTYLALLLLQLVKVLLFGWSDNLFAQPAYSHHFTVDDGLPSSFVYRVFQDSEGLIWACTDRGVVRFDSQRFERFTTREGLPYNDTWGIMEDRQHRIWFMSYSTAFSYYDLRGRKIHTIRNPIINHRHELMWGFIDGGAKGVFALLSEEGRLCLTSSGRVVDLAKDTYPSTSDLIQQVPILAQQQETFIIQSIYENAGFFAGSSPALLPSGWQRQSREIRTVLFYPNQTIFASEQSLSLYNGQSIHSKRLSELTDQPDDRVVRLSRIGASGLILVVTEHGQFVIDQHLNRLPQFNFIEHLHINSLLIDREENLWIATKDLGLLMITHQALTMASIDQLRGKGVCYMTTDANGRMWLGTENGDVYWKDNQGMHRLPLAHASPTAVNSITYLGNDHLLICWSNVYHAIIPLSLLRKQQIWLNKLDYTLNSGDTLQATLQTGKAYLIRWKSVKDVCRANEGGIYVAATNQIYRMSLLEGHCQLIPLVNTRRTFSLVADKHKTLWAGAATGIQPYIIGNAGEANNSPLPKAPTESQLKGPVYDLAVDHYGALWVGTDGAGLVRLADGIQTTVVQTKGLTIKSIHYAATSDRIYAATNQGVLIVQTIRNLPFQYQLKRLSVNDGLPSQEIHSVCEQRDTLYVASNGWVSALPIPDINLPSRSSSPIIPLRISTVSVNGRTMPVRNHYELSHERNNVGVEFVAPIFGNNQSLQYEYCFLNQQRTTDSTWHPLNRRRTKEFTELDPGVYQLKLRAVDTGRPISVKTASIFFVIQPAIWQSNWFIILLLAGILGLSIGAIRLYVKWKLNRQQSMLRKVLLAQEEERQRLAADLHDDLGATLSAVRHELEQQNSTVHSLQLLDNVIDDIRTISHNLMPPEFDRLGLRAALAEAVHRISQRASIPIELIIFGNEHSLTSDIELTLYRIALELLNNVAKHAQASQASLQLLYYPDHLTLIMEDDGVGYVSDPKNPRPGIGLRNLGSRAKFLKANLQTDSTPGGTTTTLTMPL